MIYLITDLMVSISPSNVEPLPPPLVKQESDEKYDKMIHREITFMCCCFSVFSEDQKKIEKWAKEVCMLCCACIHVYVVLCTYVCVCMCVCCVTCIHVYVVCVRICTRCVAYMCACVCQVHVMLSYVDGSH